MNKKTIFRHLLMLLALLLCSARASAQEAYACYTPGNTTLTFYYDSQRSSRSGIAFGMNTGDNSPGWVISAITDELTKVVFDPSFAAARPTSTHCWFFVMEKLVSITGLNYLNTSEVTNMAGMFCKNPLLTSLDVSHLNTSKVITMNSMFKGCEKLTSLDVSSFNTTNVTDMRNMFEDCSALTSLDVSNWNTSKVANMYEMFRRCQSLTTLDVSQWNTSNVTDMSYMFSGCSGLTSLNVSSFNTSKVKEMDNMFEGCSSLTSLDLSNFNTSQVTDMSSMFIGCSSLTSIDLSSSFNTSKVTDMHGMFDGCYNLASLDLSSFNTSQVTEIHWMFRNCYKLTTLKLCSNFITSNVTNTDGLFRGCNALTSLDVSSFNMSQVADMSSMFDGCSSLTSLDVSNWDISNDTTLMYTFRNCEALTSLNVSNWNTSNVVKMTSVFDGCRSLTSLDVSNWDTSNATSLHGMFTGCSSLTSIDLSHFNTSKATTMTHMFDGCSSLTSLDVSHFNTANVTQMFATFRGCSRLTSLYLGNFNTSNVIDMGNMFKGCSGLTSLDLSNFNTSNVTRMGYMFDSCSGLTSLDLSNFNTSNVTSMEYMFKGCSGLTSLNLNSFNTSKVKNMDSMFEGCSALTSLDLSSFNTPKVDNMNAMFYGCSGLTSLDLSSFDTSQLNFVSHMFYRCSGLTSLDLSSWDTSNVTGMSYMFFDCCNLQTIYVSDGWSTDAVTSSDYMFSGCEHLVGGKGTTWKSSNPTDKTYAHIDGGTSNPGYFTLGGDGYASYNPTAKLLAFYCDDLRSYHEGRGETTYDLNQGSAKPGWYTDGTYAKVTRVHFDPSFVNARPQSTYYWFADMANLDNITNSTYINTSEVKNMESMFQGCRKMTSLDLSHFNTSKVTTMAHMFDGCTQATVLNVSNFDTSNVTDMEGMFSYCNSLTSLDVSHFNTAKVTNMSKMFNTCCDLTSLDVSNFDTSNVTDMSWMFQACLILESLDLSSFNTEKVTNMESMFNLCGQLRTIYIADRNDKWSTAAVTKSDFMFDSCKNLVGGKGTAYASNHVDKTYARIDQPTLRPGYFTVLGTEAYAVYSKSSKTLTFHYDAQRSYTTNANVVYDVNMDADDPAWLFSEYVSIVTKVIFSPYFAAVRPTNTSRWFQGMALLTSITGMENLNTSKVTKMDYMFRGCTELSGVDLSHFDTFYVKSMAGMFQGCSSVTELDLGNFTTRYFLVDTRYMFKDCLSLKTIKVDPIDWNSYDVTSSTEMFSGCNNLVGGQGTRYNASNPTDKTYSRIDGGTDNPGYLTNKNSEGWLYEAYAVYTTEEGERTLTFYYDTQKNSRTGSIYNVEYHNWLGTASNMNRVVFDPSFADYRPTSTSEWFLNMSNLLSIEGIEYLNTSEVTDMSSMFNNCGGQYFLMKTLDLSHFNTAKVTNMQAMFANNSHLTTIIVGNGWTTDAVTNSANMFYGCTQLKGDQGTAYNVSKVDATYARLDGGTGSPGYFSHFKEPYACYMAGNKSLTFYYDNQRSSRAGTTYDLNTGNNRPGWTEDYSVASAIRTVAFDQSFATALPATTAYWFADMAGLRTITGWENLNTQFVTDMSYMFSNCGMPTLDLSSFNTFLTRDMSYMFYRCRAASIDLSSFDTSSVTTMEGMFNWCFNLTRLDLDNFKTPNVEVMTSMFENCPYLNTICVGTNWSTAAVTASDNMFYGCTRLVGGLGTAYSVANPQDKTYAHLDGGTSNPGYFSRFQAYAVYTQENTTLTFYYDSKRDSRTGTTYDMNKNTNAPGWEAVNSSVTTVVFDPSFADYCPTTTCRWFYVMQNLQTIEGLSYLNTSEVTNMQAMFNLCSSLTRLDLRGFNTAKVTSMGMMFNGCSSLQTIYVGDGWSTAAVTSSNYMFRSCGSLVGGKGTTYDANHVDKTYAHIDGGTSNPGYFSTFLGDVNLDGVVNAADMWALADIIIGNPPATYSREAADLNGDSNVSIQDLTLLIRMLLP